MGNRIGRRWAILLFSLLSVSGTFESQFNKITPFVKKRLVKVIHFVRNCNGKRVSFGNILEIVPNLCNFSIDKYKFCDDFIELLPGWIIIATASNFVTLLLGRFIQGLSDALSVTPSLQFASEISQVSYRGVDHFIILQTEEVLGNYLLEFF